jgi:hypothetical protein
MPVVAGGRLAVDTVSAPPTWRVRERVAEWDAASVTRAVKVKVPFAVGVPFSTPAVLSVRPGGSAPADTDHA